MAVNPAETRSPRAVVMQKFKELWKKVNSGRYFCKRGAINWINFPFENFPYAVALLVDQCTILRDSGMNEAQVTMEVFAKIPKQPSDTALPEIDDDTMDDIVNDIETVLAQMKLARDRNPSFPVVFKIDFEKLTVVETHDLDLQVQGAIVQFTVGY